MIKQKKSKLFGIGFHKTGTTSLGIALSILGYKNCKGLKYFKAKWSQELTIQFLQEKNYKPFLDFVGDYDSSQDNPWYLMYEELDNYFPNSKFILTERSVESWRKSCLYFFKDKKKPIHQIIYGTTGFIDNELTYLQKYQEHNQKVKAYFKDRPEDLLIVNWENGDGWKELCSFLDKPIIALPFPHFNKGIYTKKVLK